MITFTVRSPNIVEVLRRKGADAVREKADELGQQVTEAIPQLIQSEMPRSGRADKRGMTAMHDMPFSHTTSGAALPIRVTVTCDAGGSSLGKFMAHDRGAKAHTIRGAEWIAFDGRDGDKVVKQVNHPGTSGKQFMRRGMARVLGRLGAAVRLGRFS